MDVGVEVAERLHFDVRCQLPRPPDAVENRRDDDHRARRLRNVDEIEAGKPARRHQARNQSLNNLNRQLTRRHEGQQRNENQHR